MTTALVPLDTLGATIRAHVEKGDASLEKAEQHYRSAGLHLVEAKERVKQTPGLTWPRFLIEHCQIRRARADELIMIADGRTTLAELRMKKAESVRATRERKRESPLRSGDSVVNRHTAEEWASARAAIKTIEPDEGDSFRMLHPMDPKSQPVSRLLPTDLCARAWAYQLAAMKPSNADEWSYHGLCEAFARLSPAFRMKVMVAWFNSFDQSEQLEFHDKCPSPLLPKIMGDWLVDALFGSVNYRPKPELDENDRKELAFAEMTKVVELYKAWAPEMQKEFESRFDTPECVPAFLRKSAA